jgi:hypothetical protein
MAADDQGSKQRADILEMEGRISLGIKTVETEPGERRSVKSEQAGEH